MEVIDPDYYKNLQLILEHNLEDIGLELTFSIEDFSFGRRDIIDLIPNGRNIPVTEDEKEKVRQLGMSASNDDSHLKSDQGILGWLLRNGQPQFDCQFYSSRVGTLDFRFAGY